MIRTITYLSAAVEFILLSSGISAQSLDVQELPSQSGYVTQEEYEGHELRPFDADKDQWQQLVDDLKKEEYRDPKPKKEPKKLKPGRRGPLLQGDALWKAILFTLLGAILVFLLLRLSGMGIFRSNPKLLRKGAYAVGELSAESPRSEFDVNLRAAADAGDYRMVIRLSFLLVLKGLHEEGLITWKRDKTNFDYISEIEESELRRKFSLLSDIFSWTWYGELPVSESDYARVAPLFSVFLNQLKTRKA